MPGEMCWRGAVLVLACVAACARPALGFTCPPTAASCTCTSSGDHYEIICYIGDDSLAGTQLGISFSPNRYYTIDCYTNHANFDYDKLPRFQLSYTTFQTVELRGCPLPKTSLGSVISSLGITKTGGVKFHSSGNLSSSIQRHHLQGLAELKTTRLILSSNGFTELPRDLFADVGNLTWLSLVNNNIILPKGFFEYLPKLDFLELSDNKLKDIPDDMLSHLSSLKKLYLWHNNIHTLTKSVFKGLAELRELDLSSNNLTEVPQEIFQHLKKLNTISLRGNKFTSLPANLFSDNKELETILLSNNDVNLTALPEYFLSGVTKLKIVKLYRIGLEKIPENAFVNSTQITNISLAENNMEILPGMLFQDQINMVNLDLSHNKIKVLPDEIFSHLQSLEYLDLSRNLIEAISRDLFDNLQKLTHLLMQDNQLKRIEYTTFAPTKSLAYINLSHNLLNFTDTRGIAADDGFGPISPLNSLINLKELDLSHNMISTIYADWRITLIRLEKLDLSYNRIEQIQDIDVTFQSNSKLLIDLTHNNISYIRFEEAEKHAMQNNKSKVDSQTPSVSIGHNPISCDCLLTSFVQYLRDELHQKVRASVDINATDLTCDSSPPGTDLKGRPLATLDPKKLLCTLDDNPSRSKLCPDGCSCFVRLLDNASILECMGGSLDAVPDISEVNVLNHTELHLENNGLTRIARSGAMPEFVTHLYLNNNNLTELSVGDIPRSIEVLNLKNNKIRHLNASIAEMVVNGSRLQELWLSGNPFACDCENSVFLALVQKHRLKVKDYDDLYCAEGSSKSIKFVSVGSLCGATPELIGVSIFIALLGLFMGLAVALYYKYSQTIKVWLFAKGIFLWFITEKELDKDKQYDAFISFCHQDERFVINDLVEPLEKGPTPFKICVHLRDWPAGGHIIDSIEHSVKNSRRTIIVLSQNFINSDWGRLEFMTAHTNAMQEGRARVIVVILEDKKTIDVNELDPQLQSYLKTNTYVKWGDPWFWEKLKYAMPHPQHGLMKNVTQASITKKNGFDDRLELIHSASPTTPPALNTPPAHQAHNGFATSPAPTSHTKFPVLNGHINGTITMNGLKVNGNAKHSEV